MLWRHFFDGPGLMPSSSSFVPCLCFTIKPVLLKLPFLLQLIFRGRMIALGSFIKQQAFIKHYCFINAAMLPPLLTQPERRIRMKKIKTTSKGALPFLLCAMVLVSLFSAALASENTSKVYTNIILTPDLLDHLAGLYLDHHRRNGLRYSHDDGKAQHCRHHHSSKRHYG